MMTPNNLVPKTAAYTVFCLLALQFAMTAFSQTASSNWSDSLPVTGIVGVTAYEDNNQAYNPFRSGFAALNTGDYQNAEEHFRNALVSEPTSLQAQCGLAESLTGEGKFSDAIAIYEALCADKKNADMSKQPRALLYKLTILYCYTSRWNDAVAAYTRASSAFAPYQDTIHGLAVPKITISFTQSDQKYLSLLAAANAALARLSVFPSPLGNGGQDRIDAAKYAQRAYELMPDSDVIRFYRAFTLNYSGHYFDGENMMRSVMSSANSDIALDASQCLSQWQLDDTNRINRLSQNSH